MVFIMTNISYVFKIDLYFNNHMQYMSTVIIFSGCNGGYTQHKTHDRHGK